MKSMLSAAVAAAAVIVCVANSGCATARPGGNGIGSTAAAVVPAGFRLRGIRVVWQDNPGFRYRFSFLAPRSSVNPAPSDSQRKQVADQMKEILDFYRSEAVPLLTKSLVDEGVPPGADHRIILTPISAYQASNGSGTTFNVKVTIVDESNRPIWTTDIESSSGFQLFGPRLSRPDDTYVRNFVSALTRTMRSAGVVGVS
jgi:hypothetical protein